MEFTPTIARIWNFSDKTTPVVWLKAAGIFDIHLERLIEPSEPPAMLADQLDWDRLEQSGEECFAKTGRCGVPARFAIGMLFLKSIENLSDEDLFDHWNKSAHWQYFTGETYYRKKLRHNRMGAAPYLMAPYQDLLDLKARDPEAIRFAALKKAIRQRTWNAFSQSQTYRPR